MTDPEPIARERQLALLGSITGEVLRELTDPITTILSHAELLCDPDRPPHELHESIGSILHEALRCRRILALAGTLGQAGQLDCQPLDVEALAADVALAVAARRRPDDPEVRFVSRGGSTWVAGDRAVLCELIAGLVEASIEERHALGDGGHVEVASRGLDGRVEIAVVHDLSQRSGDEALPTHSLMAKVAARLLELQGGRLELRGDRDQGARILLQLQGMEQIGRFSAGLGPRREAAPRTSGG